MSQPARQATVFGARGFVGRHLVQHLRESGYAVREITRGDDSWRGGDLGHVFYTIGLTADFRSQPFETIDAHVSVLVDVLRTCRFSTFVYCSSTRVYASAPSTDEAQALVVAPHNPDHLYNLSKLMGESACLGSGLSGVRVARLSNVFGAGDQSANFLTSVLQDAVEHRHVTLRTSLHSAKDYVWIGDVTAALCALSEQDADPITNIASGRNTSHAEIVAVLEAELGATVDVTPDAPTITFPPISTTRLRALTSDAPRSLVDELPSLLRSLADRPRTA